MSYNHDHRHDDFEEADRVLAWGLGRYIILVVVLASLAVGLFGVFGPIQMATQRRIIQQSPQYAAANVDAFATDLAAIKKIEVQLARLDPNAPERQSLLEQQDFLKSELHRIVQKLPVDARTPDMIPYQ
jgi:hypothetical protein